MGKMISTLCADKPENKEHFSSILRRQVRAEVIQPKKHLKREDSALPEKSCLARTPIAPQYDMLESVGHGAYGQVQKATFKSQLSTNRVYAVKSIDKSQFQKEIRRFVREIEILKCLDHPNIIRFYEAYDSKNVFYIVQEFCSGGDLGKVFAKYSTRFPENLAKDYMWQIMLALNYIHNKGIAHRDIKPENFLLLSPEKTTLKLIDFGLSATINSTYETIKETVGTTFYIAPEVLELDYSPLCDVWSAGVILYNFITCAFPFDAPTNDELFELIKAGKYDKDILPKSGYSSEAIDLLDKMLRRETEGRISAAEALQHPWFDSYRAGIKTKGEALVTTELLENLRAFSYRSLTQRELSSLVVQTTDFDSEEVMKLCDVFRYMDQDLSGTLSAREIEAIYEKFNIKLRDGEIEEIIDSLYFKEKALVTYLEFIAATLDKEFYRNKQRIRELFNYMDVDLSGEIDYKDIQECFKRFGRLLDDSKIKRMISECDNNRDGKISFEEFYDIIVAERIRQA